jgi:hypothetical protein
VGGSLAIDWVGGPYDTGLKAVEGFTNAKQASSESPS